MSDLPSNTETAPQLDERQTRGARAMFYVGLVWLAALAVCLHFYEKSYDAPVFLWALALLGILTPLFWFEAVWARSCRTANRRQLAWAALLPALRLGVRDPSRNSRIWLPGMGWRDVNSRLQDDVSRHLNGPMLAMAVLVLPVVLVEYLLHERLETDVRLERATQFATALIWWAFTVEFVLMVSVTSKRLDYCLKHWLDLAIILLPLLWFLRALRLGRLLRLNSLTKTARLYKLRGVAMRTYRALLLMEFVRRLLHGSPARRLSKLRQRLMDHEAQMESLRAEIAALELEVAALEADSVPVYASQEST